MKKLKSTVVFMLVTICLVSSAFAAAKDFSDINEGDWYYEYIDLLAGQQVNGAYLIEGYPDGTFRPESNITVAEFLKIIMLPYSDSKKSETEHWAANYIATARKLGVIDSDEFPESDWDTNINRQQIAKVASRYMLLILKENEKTNTAYYIERITDWDSISADYKDHVAQTYAKGIVHGYPDGSFQGESSATRAEAVTMIVRVTSQGHRLKNTEIGPPVM